MYYTGLRLVSKPLQNQKLHVISTPHSKTIVTIPNSTFNFIDVL